MRLELREVTKANEVQDCIRCYLESSLTPESAFTYFAAPVIGQGARAHEDRVVAFASRQWFAHSIDPSCRWVKVVDTDADNRVVATSRWNVYTEDAFKNGPRKPSLFYMPEGPMRDYGERLFTNLETLRVRHQPHVFCNYTFTLPSYRRRGAGRLMLEWAVRQADDLGVESFIEGTPMGSKLYLNFGFRIERVVDLDPPADIKVASEEWRAVRQRYGGITCAVLRRPAGGQWEAAYKEPTFPPADFNRNRWILDG